MKRSIRTRGKSRTIRLTPKGYEILAAVEAGTYTPTTSRPRKDRGKRIKRKGTR